MAPDKQKYLFTFDEPIFAFAGIARDCQIKDEIKRCGVILTTEANDVVRPIHVKNRMPVVLHKYDYKRWLNPNTSFEELRQMMLPPRTTTNPTSKNSSTPIQAETRV
jgi:putative SOS response-associated peptidase YedK